MTNADDTQQKLTDLETRIKGLEKALMAEKRRGDKLQALLEKDATGVEHLSDSYERAFEQAAKSYHRIIEEALTLRGKQTEKPPSKSQPIDPLPEEEQQDVTLIGHVANIFDDLPKVLSSLAIVISLIAGSTSISSLFQIDSVNNKVEFVSEKADTAQDQALDAKRDAEAAKDNAAQAQLNAEFAKEDASEAKQEAEQAKQEVQQVEEDVQQVEEKVEQVAEEVKVETSGE